MNATRVRRLSALAMAGATAAFGWIPMPTGVWPDGTVPVAFELESTAPSKSIQWNANADGALAAWNPYLQRVQLKRIATEGSPAYDNGRNELFFSKSIYGEPFPDGVLAVTIVTTEEEQPIEADIVFNSSEAWGVYAGALALPTIDFKRVVVHELGHVLGIDHPDEAGQKVSAIMNSLVSGIETPTADDQAAAHGLYDLGPGAAPVILATSTSFTSFGLTAGESAELTVSAGGRGPFAYVWKRDGLVIPGANSAVLEIPVVGDNDRGTYSVTVTSAAGSVTSNGTTLSVSPASPPQSWWQATGGTVTVGEAFTIEPFTLSGSYPMTFEWHRDGVLVGSTATGKFTVHDAQFSDAGDYTVTMRNYAGAYTSTPFHLTVIPPMAPRFTRDLASRAVLAGSEVALSAEVTGSAPLTYLWRKNGDILANQSGSTVKLSSFTAADAGNYTLTVSNRFGEATSDPCALTTLATKPVINFHSASLSEFPGARIDLSVDATSPNGFTVQWFKDGVALTDSPGTEAHLSGAKQSYFVIRDLAAADAGLYTAEVIGQGGVNTTYGIHVEVLAAPKPVILLHPSPHSVMVGGKVSLTVGVRAWFTNRYRTGTAGYSYQWFKDGQPVAGQTSATWEFTAQAADAGRYFVRVSSAGGATDSDTVDVEIKSAPPLLTIQPGSSFYDPSDSESLRLGAIAFEIQMRRFFRDSGYTGTYSFATTSGQVVSSPFVGLSVIPGTYTVVVSQNGVTATSKPFTLGYQPPMVPALIAHPLSRAVDPGQTATLSVQAVGYAVLSYQWTKNGAAIPGATDSSLVLANFSARDAGSYRVTVSDAAGATVSDPAEVTVRDLNPPVVTRHPASVAVLPGTTAAFDVAAIGDALRYQWSKNGDPIPGATTPTLTINSVSTHDAGLYAVTVSNGASAIASRSAHLTILAATNAPVITRQPASTNARLDGEVTLTVAADAVPPPTAFQWQRNGVDLRGATDCELRLHKVTAADAGLYTVVVRNDAGAVTSQAATLAVDPSARLVNLSSRARVGVGDDVLISGFVVTGRQPRTVLIRGVGAQMRAFGLSHVLRNPLLKLFDSQGRQLATNDNWDPGESNWDDRQQRQALEAAASATGAFALDRGSADAALLTTLAPGVYSAVISGVADTGGVALVEIYEVGSPSDDRLVNLSSRALVGSGDDILIAGLVLNGAAPHRMLIRGIGPGLTAAGVKNVLPDPWLRLHRGAEVIATNDNWEDGDAAKIRATAATVGAFALKAGSRDAVLLLDLPSGVYSVHVAGVGGGSGVALLEIYEVPQ